jgi:hypothetical protein
VSQIFASVNARRNACAQLAKGVIPRLLINGHGANHALATQRLC